MCWMLCADTWKLLLCVHNATMIDAGNLADDALSSEHIGLYLGLAEEGDGEDRPELLARNTQFELQVLDPRQPNRHTRGEANVDVGVLKTWAVKQVTFNNELRSWGHPKFHALHTLEEDNWVGADDTLHLAVHVRVRIGRCRCPHAQAHALAPADPKRTYARYGGAWHCDGCSRTGEPGDTMYHCTAGCEYDLCERCEQARVRTISLRSRARGRHRNGRSNAWPWPNGPAVLPNNVAYWLQ